MLWNERFALGIETIDVQHKRLFRLVEETKLLLSRAREGVDCYKDIVKVLTELSDYTVYHFTFEEGLMKEKAYEDIEVHIKEHKVFVKKVSEFLATDINSDHIGIIYDMVDFLLVWISNHVLYTDAKYVAKLSNK